MARSTCRYYGGPRVLDKKEEKTTYTLPHSQNEKKAVPWDFVDEIKEFFFIINLNFTWF